MIVIFEGDSVTDCCRTLEWTGPLGCGYAMMAASLYLVENKASDTEFFNTAISGSRAKDLKERWTKTLEMKPDVLSILVGINDCWRRYDSNDITTAEEFEEYYRDILNMAKEACNPKLILCEPFVLPTPIDREAWREDLDPKIQVVRKLAREFGAILVPLDGLFAGVASLKDPSFWAPDGVHPSPAGHALIAKAWLEAAYSVI